MIKVIQLRHKKTHRCWWAQVKAEKLGKTAIGTREVNLKEKHAFARAVHWAQMNAILQLGGNNE